MRAVYKNSLNQNEGSANTEMHSATITHYILFLGHFIIVQYFVYIDGFPTVVSIAFFTLCSLEAFHYVVYVVLINTYHCLAQT